MKKVLITLVTLSSLLSLCFSVFAAEEKTESSSLPTAQTVSAASKKASEAMSVKRVRTKTFSGLSQKVPKSAILEAQKQASKWLEYQDASKIISYSETVACKGDAGQGDNCSAFVTILYWRTEKIAQ